MTDTHRDRERSESGEFVEETTLDDVLDVFTRVRGPVITTSDVAAELDCTTESARQKLRRLYDQDRVDRRKTGRTTVYWRPSDPTDTDADAAEDIAADGSPSRPATGGSAVPAAAPGAPQDDERGDDALDDFLDGVEFPGRGDREREARAAAIRRAYDLVREQGTVESREIQETIWTEFKDEPIGYSPSTSSRGPGWTLWDSCVRGALRDLPGVVPPPERKSTWRYEQ